MIVEVDVVLGGIVGHVEVVGEGRELGSDGVDLLDEGLDAGFESHAADGDFVGAPELGELAITETETLGLEEDGWAGADVGGAVAGHSLGEVAETLELGKEPLVDLGELPDLVDGVALVHGVGDGEQTLVGGGLELILNAHESLGLVETEVVEVNGTDSLLDGFLERSTNAHDLTDTLHGGTKLCGHTSEFLEIPSGHLDHTVIERGLEAGTGGLGD